MAHLVTVFVENLAPEDGVVLSPMWVGFHNGTFDIFNPGEEAEEFLERLAEDATIDSSEDFPVTIGTAFADFVESGLGTTQGTIAVPGQIFPGELAVERFVLPPETLETTSRYFSYGSMILPSNDAFVANGNPLAFEVYDENGDFEGGEFIVAGSNVWDAGTEVNDEIPENTAFFGQEEPDTGDDENGVVNLHPGFIPNGDILTAFPGGDFTEDGYQVARITISQDIVGEPESEVLQGTEISESIVGLAGDDTLNGFGGNDIVIGSRGNDLLRGVDGNDTLEGRQGFDRLLGGDGEDVLLGGQGRDRMNGGSGNDILTGGASIDFFIFATNDEFNQNDIGVDTITDFDEVRDLILLDLDTFTAIASDPSNTDNPGFSVEEEFDVVNNDASAGLSDAFIVYSQATGNLFYNQNGSVSGLGTGVQFATLQGRPDIEAEDFILRA
ncbi:MAG: spondin domain-containing protein [Microcoleaceae cyanobacterium]